MRSCDVLPGSTVGRFVVERLVGQGGMAAVYLAHDAQSNRAVAVKLLTHDHDDDGDRARRFLHEARALMCLRHPRIVALFEMGEHDGARFLAMEWVQGVTLAERLAGGPPSEAEALRLLTEVADGLSAAHALGLAHRDLKPSNIMIDSRGEAKLLDFGLVKPVVLSGETERSWATVDGTLLGTPAYMAPEQARGEELTLSSDVFSFGAVAFEVLTGEAAFARDTTLDTLNAVVECDYPRLPRATTHRQRALQELVRRCLSREPAERPRDAREVLVDLQRIAAGADLDNSRKSARQRAGLWAAAATAAAALLCAIALWSSGRAEVGMPSPPGREVRQLGVSGTLPVLADTGGWLVHSSPDSFEIRRSTLDGGSSKLLWRGSQPIRSLALSRDGLSVLFAASEDGRSSWIWELPVEGGLPRKITRGHELAVSPDGTRLAVIERHGRFEQRIVECLRDGTEHRLLATFDGSMVPVSCAYTDQDLLAVVSDGLRWSKLIRISGTTAAVHELVTIKGVADAGLAVAVARRCALWCVRTSPGAAAMVFATSMSDGATRALYPGPGLASHPNLSSDGSRAVFQLRRPQRQLVEVGVNPHGTEPRAVSRTVPILAGASQPRVSPDGRRLVYQSSHGDLWVMERATGKTGPLLTTGEASFNPAWSADGRWLAYSCLKDHRNALWIAGADGRSPRRVTDDTTNTFQPVWHPDGRHLFFISDREGPEELFRLNIDSGQVLRMTRGGAANPAVSADGRHLAYSVARDRDTSLLRLARLAPDLQNLETLWERPVEVNQWAGAKSRFSPDGRWLAFDQPSGESGGDVWAVPVADGAESEPVRLTAFKEPVNLLGWFDWVDDEKLIVATMQAPAELLLVEDIGRWLDHFGFD
jgi:serine/threonine protein kinase